MKQQSVILLLLLMGVVTSLEATTRDLLDAEQGELLCATPMKMHYSHTLQSPVSPLQAAQEMHTVRQEMKRHFDLSPVPYATFLEASRNLSRPFLEQTYQYLTRLEAGESLESMERALLPSQASLSQGARSNDAQAPPQSGGGSSPLVSASSSVTNVPASQEGLSLSRGRGGASFAQPTPAGEGEAQEAPSDTSLGSTARVSPPLSLSAALVSVKRPKAVLAKVFAPGTVRDPLQESSSSQKEEGPFQQGRSLSFPATKSLEDEGEDRFLSNASGPLQKGPPGLQAFFRVHNLQAFNRGPLALIVVLILGCLPCIGVFRTLRRRRVL